LPVTRPSIAPNDNNYMKYPVFSIYYTCL